MRDAHEELSRAGGEVVLIGMGMPEQAAEFKRQHDLPFRLLVDDDRRSYELAGMRYGSYGEVIGPRNLRRAAQAIRGGAKLVRPKQDHMQLGGAVVIAPGGEVRWRYGASASSDNAAPAAIAEQLRAAASAA